MQDDRPLNDLKFGHLKEMHKNVKKHVYGRTNPLFLLCFGFYLLSFRSRCSCLSSPLPRQISKHRIVYSTTADKGLTLPRKLKHVAKLAALINFNAIYITVRSLPASHSTKEMSRPEGMVNLVESVQRNQQSSETRGNKIKTNVVSSIGKN